MSSHRPPFALLMGITVTGITANPLVTASLPEIMAGVGAPASAAGIFVAAATLPGIALAPAIGLLADRFGRREVLVPCLVLFGVAGGLAALSPSLWVLVALRVAQGAGAAGLINLAVVIIGDHWDGPARARLIGRNSATITVCLATLPFVGGLLTELGGWRAPFLVYPLSLVTAAVVALMLPRSQPRDVTVRAQLREALPVLRRPAVAAVMGASVLVFVLIFAELLTVMPLYLDERFGLSSAVRGLILGVPAAGSTAAALSLAQLTGRLGRRRLLIAAAGLQSLALAVLALDAGLLVLVVAVVVFGLGEGSLIPSLQDMAASAAGASTRGAVVATMVSAARLGQTLGPLGATAMLAVGGPSAAFAVGAVVAAGLLAPLCRRATRTVGPAEPAAARGLRP